MTLVDTGDETHDRRPAQARRASYVGRRDVLLHLRRRRRRRRHRRADRLSSRTGTQATVTAVQPPGRFGVLDIDGDTVTASRRSRTATAAGSTAASSCSSPRCSTTDRGRPDGLGARAARAAWRTTASCRAYRHHGFWQPMDTLRDKNHARGAVGSRATPPWKSLVIEPRLLARTGASSSPATPASRAPGWRCWLHALGAEVHRLRARAADRRRISVRRGSRRPAIIGPSIGDVRDLGGAARGARRQRRRRSSSTWPRSRWCARPTTNRSRPSRPT